MGSSFVSFEEMLVLQVEHPPSLPPQAVQWDLRLRKVDAIEASAALPTSSVWGISILERGTIEPTGNSSCSED
ncbi:hypothetical protein LBMAG35_04310 [Chlorobiota bacterium]|nr:hypothetical protein LBMAG35_04310 [Chlorobiota bacterium]